jgi:hypothetical protein
MPRKTIKKKPTKKKPAKKGTKGKKGSKKGGCKVPPHHGKCLGAGMEVTHQNGRACCKRNAAHNKKTLQKHFPGHKFRNPRNPVPRAPGLHSHEAKKSGKKMGKGLSVKASNKRSHELKKKRKHSHKHTHKHSHKK